MPARAIGYCTRKVCENYLKGVFLLNHGDIFNCLRCRNIGFIEPESRIDSGKDVDADVVLYKKVQVHFDFSPDIRQYTKTAVVEISELSEGEVYEIRTPLVHTESRAMRIAETTLCTLNSGLKQEDGKFTSELIIQLDSDDWRKQLKQLEGMLGERERRVMRALS